MASTFGGLNIAYTGLVASSAALNTTANNIANIETEGYSRQVVNQTAATAMRAYQSYGCVGAGVDTLGAERVRDLYYDEKYWTNNSKTGAYEKKQYYCSLIETYLNDTRGTNAVKGFTTIFSEYQASLESLSTHAGESNYALDFVGKSGNLTEYFNLLYNSFQEMQTDINDEIKIDVDQINSIAQQIATLNKQINVIELDGKTVANELRDKRDLLIDNLSSLIDVECEEKDMGAINGNETGLTEYTVKIAGGQLLVNGNDYRQLECIPRTSWQKVNQNEADGLYDVYWTDTGEDLGMYGDSTKGELKGLYEMRDGNNKEAFNGTVADVDVINNTVKIKVTDDYLMDISKSTIPLSDGQITIGGDDFYYESYEYEIDSSGNCYYTFKMSDDTSRNPIAVSTDKIGQSSKIGEKVDYQGVAYYLEQMNEWVRDFAYSFNKIYGQEGATDQNGDLREGAIFFTGADATSDEQFALELGSEDGIDYVKKYSSTDKTGYFNLTAGNVEVSLELQYDATKLATHTGQYEGESKYDILTELKDLSTNKDKMVFRGCDAQSFLICLMGDAALNAQSANSFYNIYTSIDESISNSRLSISGVDADEEAANMIKFQNAYNLASKMISVLNECYEQLILETGV
jgi:flagellar hook-associated protein 1 FlgK